MPKTQAYASKKQVVNKPGNPQAAGTWQYKTN